jgi:hypothetical protein
MDVCRGMVEAHQMWRFFVSLLHCSKSAMKFAFHGAVRGWAMFALMSHRRIATCTREGGVWGVGWG